MTNQDVINNLMFHMYCNTPSPRAIRLKKAWYEDRQARVKALAAKIHYRNILLMKNLIGDDFTKINTFEPSTVNFLSSNAVAIFEDCSRDSIAEFLRVQDTHRGPLKL